MRLAIKYPYQSISKHSKYIMRYPDHVFKANKKSLNSRSLLMGIELTRYLTLNDD